MCTAATYKTKDFYFGRTLDYEFSYGEEVVVTPENYPFVFRGCGAELCSHYAMIGMAHVRNGYPLYYEAVNQAGLAIAGLNFVDNAYYGKPLDDGSYNAAQHEFIPWVLCSCKTLDEARELISRTRIVDIPFCEGMPTAQLHWIAADKTGCIVIEQTSDGMHIYENPAGVLTNNPPFPQQMLNLSRYMSLSPCEPENSFSDKLELVRSSRGMGAIGLPGDLSSMSRFVRAAFVKLNSVSGESEDESVSQFFHILGSVDQQRGCCRLDDGSYETTIYTSCCNCSRGIYYYTTYGNHQISAVDMRKTDYAGNALVRFPLVTGEHILHLN